MDVTALPEGLREVAWLVPKAWRTRAVPKKPADKGNWAGAEVLRHVMSWATSRDMTINSRSAPTVPPFGSFSGRGHPLVQRGSGLAGAVTYAIERLRRGLPRGGVQHVPKGLRCHMQGGGGPRH